MGMKKICFFPLLYSQKTSKNGYKNQTFAQKIKKDQPVNLMSLKIFYTLIMCV
jgi:hypothetical protein